MCYLVTIGTRASRANLEAIVRHDGVLAVRPARNRSLQSVFPPDDNLFELTSRHCSCDLFAPATHTSSDDEQRRLRAEYQRKGWSPARIDRALADRMAAHERRNRRQSVPKGRFCAVLRELSARPGGVRVFVHFYSGQFESEEIRSTRTASLAADHVVDPTVFAEHTLTNVMPVADASGGRLARRDG